RFPGRGWNFLLLSIRALCHVIRGKHHVENQKYRLLFFRFLFDASLRYHASEYLFSDQGWLVFLAFHDILPILLGSRDLLFRHLVVPPLYSFCKFCFREASKKCTFVL